MGFFKKIGSFVKKATKQVSFKNLVKVAGTGLSFVPGVGGIASGLVQNLQAQHEEKKALAEQAAQQATYDAQVAAANAASASLSRNPNFGEIMLGAAGGALSGAGGVLAGSTSAGNAGATLVESTTKEWFKRNWLKLVGGILGAVLVIWLFVRLLNRGKHTKRSYR